MSTPQFRVWKMLLLTWLCIYPLLNLLMFLTAPVIGHWAPPLRTFAMSLAVVPAMSLSLRFLTARLQPWLVR